jgi:hypothetical protein
MTEITRGGWFAVGVALVAAAAAAHAVSDAAHIADTVVHTEPVHGPMTASVDLTAPPESGPGGWLLVTAGLLAAGAAIRMAAGAKEIVKELIGSVPIGSPSARAG